MSTSTAITATPRSRHRTPRPARRPHRRRLGVLLGTSALFAVPVLALDVGPASAAVTCGSTITTSAKLTSDLDCTGKTLRIVGPNVTLDLNGHTIRSSTPCPSPNAGCTIIFDTGSQGSRLVNGRVDGAAVTAFTPKVTVSRVSANRTTIWLGGDGDRIVDSSTSATDVVLAHSNQAALRNWVMGGQGIRIYNTDKATRNLAITDNFVADSTGAGIWLSTYFFDGDGVTGALSRNVLFRNAADGIRLAGNLQELGALALTDNVMVANGQDGIDINGTAMPGPTTVGGPVTLTRNKAFANAGHGINARWIPGRPTGIVDGGGNMAMANLVAPQCDGVAC